MLDAVKGKVIKYKGNNMIDNVFPTKIPKRVAEKREFDIKAQFFSSIAQFPFLFPRDKSCSETVHYDSAAAGDLLLRVATSRKTTNSCKY